MTADTSTDQSKNEPRSFNLSNTAAYAATLFQTKLNDTFFQAVSEAEAKSFAVDNEGAQRFPDRLTLAFSYVEPRLRGIFRWLFESKETSNFTYQIEETNKQYLASLVAVVTGVPLSKVYQYIDEICGDAELRQHVLAIVKSQTFYIALDASFDFGRRIGWYVIARALKPKVIIETGVEQGLGALVLTSALKRNAAEGSPGQYFGTDINPKAGYLFCGEYANYGKILYGDSIQTLQSLQCSVDLFINDSDHSADYEAREYQVISPKLSERAVILGDNSHSTSKLCEFAQQTGRHFLFFHEQPKGHWYPGAGIGIAYR